MSSSLPYSTGSDTSREAAELNTTASTYRAHTLSLIEKSGKRGLCADEIAASMDYIPNIISTRLLELEEAGQIVRLAETTKTRSNRRAHLFVLPENVNGRATITGRKKTDKGGAASARYGTALNRIIDIKGDLFEVGLQQAKKIAQEALNNE